VVMCTALPDTWHSVLVGIAMLRTVFYQYGIAFPAHPSASWVARLASFRPDTIFVMVRLLRSRPFLLRFEPAC
jgi:hypothetical protein